MKQITKLLSGIITILSLVSVTATPAFADTRYSASGINSVSSTDLSQIKINVNQGVSETAGNSSSSQTNMVYGWNVFNNNPNEIYFANEQGVKQVNTWVKGGAWYYVDNDGRVVRNQWKQINGVWYFFTANGSMVQGINVGSYFVALDGSFQGDAKANVPTYNCETVYNTGYGSTTLSIADFEKAIQEGTIKVKVDRNQRMIGGATDSKTTGTLIFYNTLK